MDKNKIKNIVLFVLVYLVSTAISYSVFSNNLYSKSAVVTSPLAPTQKGKDGRVSFDTNLPKTEACPLNGVLYPKSQKEWWGQHRPLGVMIENHQEARPQSGLSFADVVYEAVAEGGITRFLAIFYCQDAGQVGPVRSARTYFLDFVSEYGEFPLYAHVGGANTPGPADALSQIDSYEWTGYNDLNQFSIPFPTFWRDYNRLGREVATEHTMYSTTAKLWDFAKTRGLTNVDKEGESWDKSFVPYVFKDDISLASRPAQSQTIHLEFWNGYNKYFIDWIYDKAGNLYKRGNGGLPHNDKNTDKQLTAKNIVVLLTDEFNANDGYENNAHLLYRTKGIGKATVFVDGKKISANWRKDKRTAKTLLFDSDGVPIKFNRGTIWFEILPTDGVVSIK